MRPQRGCPTDATSYTGVGGEGSVPGTNIVLMYDKPTDTLVFMAVNMDPAANLETAVLDELSVVATAKG